MNDFYFQTNHVEITKASRRANFVISSWNSVKKTKIYISSFGKGGGVGIRNKSNTVDKNLLYMRNKGIMMTSYRYKNRDVRQIAFLNSMGGPLNDSQLSHCCYAQFTYLFIEYKYLASVFDVWYPLISFR